MRRFHRGRGAQRYAQVPETVDGYRTTSWAPSFTPHLEDVHTVRRILSSIPSLSGLFLPNELVLSILNSADYHPIFSSERAGHLDIVARHHPFCCNELYLLGDPIPFLEEGRLLKILEVRFTIHSRDQGWTTEEDKSIQNSTSWFEVSIVRSTDPYNPQLLSNDSWNHEAAPEFRDGCSQELFVHRHSTNQLVERVPIPARPRHTDPHPQWDGSHSWFLLANNMADHRETVQEVVWKRNGQWEGGEAAGKGKGFVELLMPGDQIAIWARATRLNWANMVQSAKIDVKYTYL